MNLIKKPVNGMKDILPREMRIRDYLISLIKETYRGFGYTPIETPVVESLPNLLSKQGGDNEKLIFKVMKRGEKLNIEQAETEDDLADSGLRYDLTVPLVRFYANNANELPRPFKALQIGPVFRADRPQKGRFREFYQCDIDILGESSNLAEIELLLAMSSLLTRIGFKGFKIKINDRRLLKAMAAYSMICEEDYDKVFIILDKMDKIGADGVSEELSQLGYGNEVSSRYLSLVASEGLSLESLKSVLREEDIEVIDNLQTIINSVKTASDADFELVFDPTLVRGMSYYTGPIFEIEIAGLGLSCGGGGRYDGMVEKFLGTEVPACGFSVGFERIITILLDQGYEVPGAAKRIAYLIEKNMPADRLGEIMRKAAEDRKSGAEVSVTVMAKNKKFQKQQLEADGFTDFIEFYINPLN